MYSPALDGSRVHGKAVAPNNFLAPKIILIGKKLEDSSPVVNVFDQLFYLDSTNFSNSPRLLISEGAQLYVFELEVFNHKANYVPIAASGGFQGQVKCQ